MTMTKRWFIPFKQNTKPYATRQAFSHLYDQTYLTVYRYIYGLIGGPQHDAEDLTAESYLKAWNAREDFQGDVEDALAWLFTIAKRTVIDYTRRNQNRPNHVELEEVVTPSGELSPEEQAEQMEQYQILFQQLHQLSDEHRELIVLHHLLGWRINQIAEYMNMKPNTVSVTIKRVLERIRASWATAQKEISQYDR